MSAPARIVASFSLIGATALIDTDTVVVFTPIETGQYRVNFYVECQAPAGYESVSGIKAVLFYQNDYGAGETVTLVAGPGRSSAGTSQLLRAVAGVPMYILTGIPDPFTHLGAPYSIYAVIERFVID